MGTVDGELLVEEEDATRINATVSLCAQPVHVVGLAPNRESSAASPGRSVPRVSPTLEQRPSHDDHAPVPLAKRTKSAFRKLLESEIRLAWRLPIGLYSASPSPCC